jgi:restriction endonuclease S subunit
MRTTLKNIADVRTGYTFRGRIEEAGNGNVHVLQIRDLRKQYTEFNRTELFAEELPLIHWDGSEKSMLQQGDVVLPARGDYYNAATYFGTEKVIATSQLLIIKTNKENVLPEFLCWAINQPKVQYRLVSESRGTNIPLLSRRSLDMLTLKVPPIEKQKKIIEIQRLWEEEQQLTKKLLTNRESMLKGMFKELMLENK